ncbi:hypothetical protein DSM106972_011870 [Dulcicalothrix desertica PCC 7102]|uniref:DUF433 domain-containing protein n=1 Tax=Dulcicalothrix desertica PCC 7102 TaxID=232991 RepID=A0A3S1CV15_9CYAN|nr:DUF433 domain-containing protein [Dulcicalothrix desertica]RUT09134.1 hypothetical protein DSM106972_011870 [Dulcicalothrix desertica PCC 7102]TWH55114.1 uncharacterized protein (DUF433 family) [Dulcicalothrix desertica PCC 7102]
MLSVSTEHIEVTPEVRGGKPRIAGTRIAVEDIVVMHLKMGLSLSEIAAKYNLLMASVHAAMAYYFDNQETIDSTLTEDEAFVEAFKRSHPSRLQEKLRNLRGE